METYIELKDGGVMPRRAHPSDVGYDLTLISRKDKDWGAGIEVYGTGVYISPVIDNLYFEILPRSSIVKTPYVLANSVGVIDPSYNGELLVVLRKIDNQRPSLELPARVVQLVPRARYDAIFIEKKLEETERGAGGFGSTGR